MLRVTWTLLKIPTARWRLWTALSSWWTVRKVWNADTQADGGLPYAYTPVIIFINKMDREAKDPFDLLDELEEELTSTCVPDVAYRERVRFKRCHNIYEHNLNLYQPSKQVVTGEGGSGYPYRNWIIRLAPLADKLRGELELIDGVYPEFEGGISERWITRVLGSALNNLVCRNCWIAFCGDCSQSPSREGGRTWGGAKEPLNFGQASSLR